MSNSSDSDSNPSSIGRRSIVNEVNEDRGPPEVIDERCTHMFTDENFPKTEECKWFKYGLSKIDADPKKAYIYILKKVIRMICDNDLSYTVLSDEDHYRMIQDVIDTFNNMIEFLEKRADDYKGLRTGRMAMKMSVMLREVNEFATDIQIIYYTTVCYTKRVYDAHTNNYPIFIRPRVA